MVFDDPFTVVFIAVGAAISSIGCVAVSCGVVVGFFSTFGGGRGFCAVDALEVLLGGKRAASVVSLRSEEQQQQKIRLNLFDDLPFGFVGDGMN